MRVIRSPYVEDWERRGEQIEPFPQQLLNSEEAGLLGALKGDTSDFDPTRTCMPAGQGSGSVRNIASCAEIIERVVAEARETIEYLGWLR